MVAFERSVDFNKIPIDNKNRQINTNDYIVLEGPGILIYVIFLGLVIFEVNYIHQKRMELVKSYKFTAIYITIFVILLALFNSLLESRFEEFFGN